MKSSTLALVLMAAVALSMALPEDESAEATEEEQRDKRALSFLADKITSKFASKLGWVGPPSHPPHPPLPPPPQHELEYGPPITYHAKNFDIWAFKKAILGALFQAVKAIKGGIIAVKGQILKAKGHLLQTKGSILAAKGDAITNFGRQVAAKSLLDHSILYEGPVHSPIGFAEPSGYGAASTASAKEAAPPPLPTKASIPEPVEPSYGPPPPSFNSYGSFRDEPKEAPKDYAQGGFPNGVQAGLLVLKPISVPSSGGGGGGGLSGQFAEPPGSYESPQISQSYGYNLAGSAGNYGGYAGPLSPAAYDGSFGGHSDLSASFSQSAVQSNQKKRANLLVQQQRPHQQPQPRQPVYHGHSAPHPPSPQYHQLPLPSEPLRSSPPRVLPQRSVPPRAGPPTLTIIPGPAPPRGFYVPRTAFGQRI